MSDPVFVTPPLWTAAAFVALVLGVQALLLYAVFRTAGPREDGWRRAAAGCFAFALVMGAAAWLAESGALGPDASSPRAALYAGSCNLVAVALALGPPGRAMALAVPPVFWVLFQGFRLPLEVLLHLWNAAGTIPVQMTWSGQNPDVFSGIAALALGTLWWRRPSARWAGWLAHGIGLVLLLNVGRVAVQSVPGPFRSFDGPPLLLPFHAPFIWILPFCVAAALFAHVVGLRALRASR